MFSIFSIAFGLAAFCALGGGCVGRLDGAERGRAGGRHHQDHHVLAQDGDR
jgi:hypothetical protein